MYIAQSAKRESVSYTHLDVYKRQVWKNPAVVEKLTRFVYEGGAFIGVNEPSAVEGYDTFFRMAPVLGVDEDTGARICHGKWQFAVENIEGLMPEGSFVKKKGDYRKGIRCV